jgi:Zn finger protein HypA/HybF involved in hydrogenase expression
MKATNQLEKKNFDSKKVFNRPPIEGAFRCNLCGNSFKPSTAYVRFCSSCRSHSRLLTFSEWMTDSGVAF